MSVDCGDASVSTCTATGTLLKKILQVEVLFFRRPLAILMTMLHGQLLVAQLGVQDTAKQTSPKT
eukprot:6208868-Pleurochrysis_carterae.AAC.1